MTHADWISIVGLVMAFIITPLVGFLWSLNRKVDKVLFNHIPHVEAELKRLWQEVEKFQREH